MDVYENDFREDYEFRLCTAIDDVDQEPERVPAVYVRELFGAHSEYVVLGADFIPESAQDMAELMTYYVSSDDSTLNSVIFKSAL